MSFLQPRAKPPTAGNEAEQRRVSGYREADVLPFGYGVHRLGLKWLCQPFNWRTRYAGKNEPDFQFCSIAGAAMIGPCDFVGKVWINGKAVWDFATWRGVEDSIEQLLNNFQNNDSGDDFSIKVYWGTETQTPDSVLVSGTGQNHPAYRGICYVVLKNIDLGQGVTSLPNIEIEVGRKTPAVGTYAAGMDYWRGVNPIAAAYGVMTEKRAGARLDTGTFQTSHWQAKCGEIETVGYAGRTGTETYIHPIYSGTKELGAALSDMFSYFDGYVRVRNGKAEIGWFPNVPNDGIGLTTITEHDLADVPDDTTPSIMEAVSAVTVAYLDVARQYEQSASTKQVPVNTETIGEKKTEKLERPFWHAHEQAEWGAAFQALASSNQQRRATLDVKRSRAVNADGSPLVPGDLFNWNYQPWGLSILCRVTERQDDSAGNSVRIILVSERGAFPMPYVKVADPRVAPSDPNAAEITAANARFYVLPSGFGSTRQLALLLNRPDRNLAGANIYMSTNGATPWGLVKDQRYFACKATINDGGISDIATSIGVTSTGVDVARFTSQNAVDQSDDSLLALIDDELVSVGAIAVPSANNYTLTVLRARKGSTAAAHSNGASVWLFYRSELDPISHNELYNVRTTGDVYSASIATKYFKIESFTASKLGTPLPVDPGIAYTLPDLSVSTVNGFTILLTNEAHSVACDSSGTPLAGQLGTGGFATTQVKVLGGPTALTPVASSPGSTQFAISITGNLNTTSSVVGGTYDQVQCDTLTSDTGLIEISINVGGSFTVKKLFTLSKVKSGAAGAAGADGAAGANGLNGGYTDYIFKRSPTQPATPTGDMPVGWSDSPPAPNGNPLWMSSGDKTAAGTLVGVWSAPVQLEGDSISVEYSVDGATGWHATFTTGDKYMRQRIGAGAWSAAIKIVGENGTQGIPGPGMVYQGPYNAGTVYYKTDNRVDVVSYLGNYYPTANAAKSGTATWGVPGGSDWGAAFTNFKSVATDLLLASDATILKTLVMGDGATAGAGVIRSAGANAFMSGVGFWLGYDGVTPKFRVGDPAGNSLSWNGSQLALVGTVTASSGTIGGFTLSSTTMGASGLSLDAGNTEIRLGGGTGSSEARMRIAGGNPMFEVLSSGVPRGRLAWDWPLGVASLTFMDSGGGLVTAVSQNGFSGSGSGITNLNAGNISSGTLDNARLPANVSLSGTLAVAGNLTVPGAVGSVGGIRFNNGGTNLFAFYWDGANVRVVVDGTLQGTIPNP